MDLYEAPTSLLQINFETTYKTTYVVCSHYLLFYRSAANIHVNTHFFNIYPLKMSFALHKIEFLRVESRRGCLVVDVAFSCLNYLLNLNTLSKIKH
jgi:hypothetical protein